MRSMKIAIGLPNSLPGTPGPDLVAWAREAEARGFSSLGTIGRTVFDSHEELVALAAAAAATTRIGLATTVMIAPAREPVLLAKQAATLDAISGGRLTLGFGVGWRDDDFRATGRGALFAQRGDVLDEQIRTLRAVWSGTTLNGVGAPIGPRPARAGGPEILLGGSAPAALRRTGELADGFFALPAPGAVVADQYRAVVAAWEKAGRSGKPRLVAPRYFALGEEGRARGDANVRSYYRIAGDAFVQGVLDGLVTTEAAAQAAVAELAAVGVDELFFWPMDGDRGQIERLAKAVL
jgi:alkanesulfonate monooxygenase SsuD/methylene tetrahydromethanopterin reductase-like flavin-dependent oxidoreductase (luciferase family)